MTTLTVTLEQLVPLMKADLEVNITPLLLGEPGIGKSETALELAKTLKTKVFVIPFNQLADRADLTGVRTVKETDANGHEIYKQVFFPHATIMDAITYANEHPDETPIIFMDEINRTSPDVTSAGLSFQTLRQVGTIRFPDNIRFIAAGNDKGNIITLDDASLTRFALYTVKPALDKFLEVNPTLNPFIENVLKKYPQDLLAPKDVPDALFYTQSDPDDDDDSADDAGFLQALNANDNAAFEQLTVPRTITYLSNWLNALNIDKSNSDEERKVLTMLMTDTIDDPHQQQSVSLLYAGLIAHTGRTAFTDHVFDDIVTYYQDIIMSSTNTKTTKLLTQTIRPTQDTINLLSKADTTTIVENYVATLSEDELQKTLIWLFETQSMQEVNNINAAQTFIIAASNTLTSISNPNVSSVLIQLMANASTNLSKTAVETFINTQTPLSQQWQSVIESSLAS